ncbi:MAG: hypothetical protein ACPGED_00465 [Flavobacteriales bacterium]
MLEFCKKVLVKVSFDRILFTKELNKAIKWLKEKDELSQLKEWCIKKYGSVYGDVIDQSFQPVLA